MLELYSKFAFKINNKLLSPYSFDSVPVKLQNFPEQLLKKACLDGCLCLKSFKSLHRCFWRTRPTHHFCVPYIIYFRERMTAFECFRHPWLTVRINQ